MPRDLRHRHSRQPPRYRGGSRGAWSSGGFFLRFSVRGRALSGGLDSTVLLDAAARCAGASRCRRVACASWVEPERRRVVRALRVVRRFARRAFCRALRRRGARGRRKPRSGGPRCTLSRAGSALRRARREARSGSPITPTTRPKPCCCNCCAARAWRGSPRCRPNGSTARCRCRACGRCCNLLRAQLEHYAHERDLNWIDDESNVDTRYARNALRHDVLPVLAVHFPGFRDALARTASHAASAQRLLDELARIDLENARNDSDENALALDTLLALDDERAINLLRYWMRSLGFAAASTARMTDILRQLRDALATRDGHALRIDHAGHCLREYRGAIFWEKGDSADPADLDEGAPAPRMAVELRWQGDEVWRLAAMARHVRVRGVRCGPRRCRRGKRPAFSAALRPFARGRRTRATRRRCTEPYAQESLSGARRAGLETRRAAAVRRRDAAVRPADRPESRRSGDGSRRAVSTYRVAARSAHRVIVATRNGRPRRWPNACFDLYFDVRSGNLTRLSAVRFLQHLRPKDPISAA